MKNEELKLFTDGKIKTGEREFTRLIGGFGEGKPSITDKQIAELLEYKKGARAVRQRIAKNIKHFDFGVHIMDLKSSVPEQDTIKDLLKILDYTRQSIDLADNIYIFSEAGFLLYLKFAEGDKATEIYKNFIEDYFKIKSENKILKATLKEQIENMYSQYDLLYGKAIRTGDKELFAEASKINNKIIELEKQLSEELTIEKYKIYEDKYKKFMDNNGCFTFEATSKILSTQADNENNILKIKLNKSSLPKYLRDNKILCKDKLGKSYKNLPRSGYEKYFNTTAKDISYIDKEGNEQIMSKTQTRVTKNGLDFIYDLLAVKDSI